MKISPVSTNILPLALVILLVLGMASSEAKKLRGASKVGKPRQLQAVGCVFIDGVPIAPCTQAPVGGGAANGGGSEDDKDDSKEDDKEDSKEDDKDNSEDTPLIPYEGNGGDNGGAAPFDPDVVTGPYASPPPAQNTGSATSGTGLPTLFGLIASTRGLSNVHALINTAGLEGTLGGSGSFTVFAPDNGAFPSGTDFLRFQSQTARGPLESILTYHVVAGTIRSTDLYDGATFTTVQGSNVTIGLANGTKVNDANIIDTDMEASNGVLHIIDSMLTPPNTADASTVTISRSPPF